MRESSSSKTWVLILILLLVAAAVWWLMRGRSSTEGADPARGENPSLLLDRVWIDSKPEKHTDYMQAMIVLSDAPIGAFQKASAYHLELEIFEFQRDGAKVSLTFPQHDKRAKFSYRIEKCDELPPFDLCLTLSTNPWKGPKRYYGASDQGDEERATGDLRHRLLHDLRVAD